MILCNVGDLISQSGRWFRLHVMFWFNWFPFVHSNCRSSLKNQNGEPTAHFSRSICHFSVSKCSFLPCLLCGNDDVLSTKINRFSLMADVQFPCVHGFAEHACAELECFHFYSSACIAQFNEKILKKSSSLNWNAISFIRKRLSFTLTFSSKMHFKTIRTHFMIYPWLHYTWCLGNLCVIFFVDVQPSTISSSKWHIFASHTCTQTDRQKPPVEKHFMEAHISVSSMLKLFWCSMQSSQVLTKHQKCNKFSVQRIHFNSMF